MRSVWRAEPQQVNRLSNRAEEPQPMQARKASPTSPTGILISAVTSQYDANLRQLLMLSRTKNFATAALFFVDRDTDQEHYNHGYCGLMFGGPNVDAGHSRLSRTPVQV